MHLLFDLVILFAELCKAYVQVRAHMYVERFEVLLFMGKETLEKMQRPLVEKFRKNRCLSCEHTSHSRKTCPNRAFGWLEKKMWVAATCGDVLTRPSYFKGTVGEQRNTLHRSYPFSKSVRLLKTVIALDTWSDILMQMWATHTL